MAYEIGTDRGLFADDLLARWPTISQWFCVDPYGKYEEMPFDRASDMLAAVDQLMKYRGKVKFWRGTSGPIVNHSLATIKRQPCFVYIDGSHVYEDVRDDIETWDEVLPDGSILAGHDYDEEHDGVMRAVQEFADETGTLIRLTWETKEPPSWYCYKGGEPETMMRRLFIEDEIPNVRRR